MSKLTVDTWFLRSITSVSAEFLLLILVEFCGRLSRQLLYINNPRKVIQVFESVDLIYEVWCYSCKLFGRGDEDFANILKYLVQMRVIFFTRFLLIISNIL